MNIRTEVLKYLEGCGSVWTWGGTLCRIIAPLTNHKEDMVSRELRRMVVDKVVEVEKAQVNGEGPKCVRYRCKQPILSSIKVEQTLFN
jgi:hypothetical protein